MSAAAIRAAWLTAPATRAVMAALSADGATPRFVGGCVRNALLGPPFDMVSDIDIAINVPPRETMRLLREAKLRAIPTGIDHGTVTTLARGQPFEVTTLRRDVETFGRRASVAFTNDWDADAARRDFTINALYADADGTVVDPLAGLADLRTRRVRFILRAEDRIREDCLRILRFFRFHAWYGEGEPDPEGLAACAALRDRLAGLARERIGREMRKLLAAPDPAAAVRAMAGAGVLTIAAPGAEPDGDLMRLCAFERKLGIVPDWRRRLLALAPAAELRDALRLSNEETRAMATRRAAMAARRDDRDEAGALGYRHGAEAARDALIAAAARDPDAQRETRDLNAGREAQSPGAERNGRDPDMEREARALGLTRIEELALNLDAAAHGAAQRFPLTASDLLDAGFPPGPKIGATLRRVEEDWIRRNFSLDRAALLQQIPGDCETG